MGAFTNATGQSFCTDHVCAGGLQFDESKQAVCRELDNGGAANTANCCIPCPSGYFRSSPVRKPPVKESRAYGAVDRGIQDRCTVRDT